MMSSGAALPHPHRHAIGRPSARTGHRRAASGSRRALGAEAEARAVLPISQRSLPRRELLRP
jgi:hypothetical protein